MVISPDVAGGSAWPSRTGTCILWTQQADTQTCRAALGPSCRCRCRSCFHGPVLHVCCIWSATTGWLIKNTWGWLNADNNLPENLTYTHTHTHTQTHRVCVCVCVCVRWCLWGQLWIKQVFKEKKTISKIKKKSSFAFFKKSSQHVLFTLKWDLTNEQFIFLFMNLFLFFKKTLFYL